MLVDWILQNRGKKEIIKMFLILIFYFLQCTLKYTVAAKTEWYFVKNALTETRILDIYS